MLDTAQQTAVRSDAAAGPRETRAEPGGGRDAYFDGIRAVAVVAVLLYHWASQYLPVFDGGYVGVDVFFVLSGFVITSVLWHRRPQGGVGGQYRAFLVGRVRRLYPALLAMLAVGTAAYALLRPGSLQATAKAALVAAGQAASFVQAVSGYEPDPFSHTWTLSVEWAFYLLWPLVLMRARRRGTPPARLAFGAAAVALLLYAADVVVPSDRWFYFSLSARAPQLLAGCALALWAASGRYRPRLPARVVEWLGFAAVAGIASWAVWGWTQTDPEYRLIGYPLITACSVVLCAVPFLSSHRGRGVQRMLSWGPAAKLGLVSYSLYLWHLLAIEAIGPAMAHRHTGVVARYAAIVAATALATWLSYRYLERPFLRGRGGSLRARPDGDAGAPESREPGEVPAEA